MPLNQPRLGRLSPTGPYVQTIGSFNTFTELTSTHPAGDYYPGTMAYTADQGLMISDGTIWDTAGAVPGEAQLTAPTYAAARLLSGVATGHRLQVLGRTTQSDGGQGLFTWVAGGATTVDEGYVLQATGGTWQRVDPSPTVGETLLNAAWYNITPTNSAVTNDTGFAKLKAQLLTSGTTTWRVYFPPGAYTYTNNRWLFGVQKVIIDAYDCTFQCTSTNVSYQNGIPLNVNDPFQDWGDVDWPGTSVYQNGYLFNTAQCGAASITTTTAADAGNFTPGMRVLLHGYDQQIGAGYPPNLRYFEYKTVLTAVAGTGVITFTDQLQNFYDSRWWDTVAAQAGNVLSFGAPRILSLERANYKRAKLIWIKGATFLANPTTPASSGLQPNGDLQIYEDVTAPSFQVICTGTQFLRRCNATLKSVGDASGGDKLVDKLIVEESTVDVGTSSATTAFVDSVGVNALSLIRSKFYGNIATIAPRHLYVHDCDIIPMPGANVGIASGGPNPIRSVVISGTRVYNPNGTLANGFQAGTTSPGYSLTVGSVVGTDIRVSFDATGKTLAQRIEYGMTLLNPTTGNTGVITAIYYEAGSPGTLRIAGTWSAPTAADVFNYYDVMQMSDGGGNRIIGAQVPFWRQPPAIFNLDSPTLTGTVSIPTNLAFPNTSKDYISVQSYGAQFLSNGTNLFYIGGGGWNAQVNLAFFAGKGPSISEGSNCRMGLATLVAGTVTVSTNIVGANSRIFLQRATTGGTVGHLSYTISAGTSFTINSSSGTETSTVAWWVVN